MAELARPMKQGQWSEAALRVLRERYLDRSRRGSADGLAPGETAEDMCWRVASAIASAETPGENTAANP